MGLDTVEILVAVEIKFGIKIPDNEAEGIDTISDFANSVFTRLLVHTTKECLKQIIFYRLRVAFMDFDTREEIKPDTLIQKLLPNNDIQEEWRVVEKSIGLKLPDLVKLDYDKTVNKEVDLFGIRLFTRTEPITDGSVRQLIDWIISINADKLLSVDKISSKYEVERIIIGIINDVMGIPINQIEPGHSIVDDLRIN